MRSAPRRLGRASLGPAVAVLVGAPWAFRSAIGFAHPNYVEPVTALDWAAVLSFTAALAAFAPGAWLIRELAGRGRAAGIAAAVLALGGLVAAVGNFVEDGLSIAAFGDVFATGLLGVLAGLIGLTAILLVSRQYLVAALPASALIGVMASNDNGGGFLILVVWLVVTFTQRAVVQRVS